MSTSSIDWVRTSASSLILAVASLIYIKSAYESSSSKDGGEIYLLIGEVEVELLHSRLDGVPPSQSVTKHGVSSARRKAV
jgi:hypothetical protein